VCVCVCVRVCVRVCLLDLKNIKNNGHNHGLLVANASGKR
jgi:hypothetical protein